MHGKAHQLRPHISEGRLSPDESESAKKGQRERGGGENPTLQTKRNNRQQVYNAGNAKTAADSTRRKKQRIHLMYKNKRKVERKKRGGTGASLKERGMTLSN